MIKLVKGNLLEAEAEALVNTVNCIGVMGKGIALQFKQAFPENFKAYYKACKNSEVKPGRVFTFPTGKMINPKYIINFPSKRHWKGKAKIQDIEAGLRNLVEVIRKLEIESIAIPPLGCGNGGLEWSRVRPLIESALNQAPNVKVLLYEPKGAPDVDMMPVDTKMPRMTRAKALFLKLFEQYSIPGYRLNMLEVQKLAYFLQSAGESLRLEYHKHKYGPYAENLNFVLQQMEGHFIRGYGDRSRMATIRLLSGASEEAEKVFANEPVSRENLEKVKKLIEGFETPYGLELLSSVHWVATVGNDPACSADEAVEKMLTWSARKKKIFKPTHIKKAWTRLAEQNWLPNRTPQ